MAGFERHRVQSEAVRMVHRSDDRPSRLPQEAVQRYLRSSSEPRSGAARAGADGSSAQRVRRRRSWRVWGFVPRSEAVQRRRVHLAHGWVDVVEDTAGIEELHEE